jgi:hypothetical protein
LKASRKRRAYALRTGALVLGGCALVMGSAGGAAAADVFTISGDLDTTLYPGGSGAVDLALTNVTAGELTVGEITVAVASVNTQPQRQCLVEDFVVTQLDQALQFSLPAGATRTLTQLGVATADLPRVAMTNTPVNQDGCKNSTVNLAFAGRAAEVGGVVLPPPSTPTPTPTPETPDESEQPDNVGGVDIDLPGTGGDPTTFWMALAGLGLVALGGGTVVVTRRTKGAQK